jgi:hypothetical protein
MVLTRLWVYKTGQGELKKDVSSILVSVEKNKKVTSLVGIETFDYKDFQKLEKNSYLFMEVEEGEELEEASKKNLKSILKLAKKKLFFKRDLLGKVLEVENWS